MERWRRLADRLHLVHFRRRRRSELAVDFVMHRALRVDEILRSGGGKIAIRIKQIGNERTAWQSTG